MALTPLDIHNKEFNTRMRGYDQDQVNDFLSQIIKDYSAVLKEKEETDKALAETAEKVKYFTDLKDALNQSILVAQEAADKVKKNAEAEAELIQQKAESMAQETLTDATEKANQILQDASDKAKGITIQTEDLRKQTRIFRQRLEVMLESQLEVVKSPEWKDLLASSTEAPEYLDPAANNHASGLETPAEDPWAPEPPDASDGQTTYTEIVFPTDDMPMPSSVAMTEDAAAAPETGADATTAAPTEYKPTNLD